MANVAPTHRNPTERLIMRSVHLLRIWFAVSIGLIAATSTVSAATVDLYEISIKATFQSEVITTPDPAVVTAPEWSPVLGKSIDLTFSMPLERALSSSSRYNANAIGDVTVTYDGTSLHPAEPTLRGQLLVFANSTRHGVQVIASLPDDAFGIADFNWGLSLSAVFYDAGADALALPLGTPHDLSRGLFEYQSIHLFGNVYDPDFGLKRLEAVAEIDSVSVTPAPVPMRASA